MYNRIYCNSVQEAETLHRVLRHSKMSCEIVNQKQLVVRLEESKLARNILECIQKIRQEVPQPTWAEVSDIMTNDFDGLGYEEFREVYGK